MLLLSVRRGAPFSRGGLSAYERLLLPTPLSTGSCRTPSYVVSRWRPAPFLQGGFWRLFCPTWLGPGDGLSRHRTCVVTPVCRARRGTFEAVARRLSGVFPASLGAAFEGTCSGGKRKRHNTIRYSTTQYNTVQDKRPSKSNPGQIKIRKSKSKIKLVL